MTDQTNIETSSPLVKRDPIVGARRISNYWWGSVILLGGLGFILTGVSSYLERDILPFIHGQQLSFVPQGLVMCFYGTSAILLSTYIWLTILWRVGEGYNEFNKTSNLVKIFRWGFPGKNRRIQISFPWDDIQAVRVEIKEGINPKRAIYLRVKGKRDIPLTRIGEPITLENLEKDATILSRFLNVSIEGL